MYIYFYYFTIYFSEALWQLCSVTLSGLNNVNKNLLQSIHLVLHQWNKRTDNDAGFVGKHGRKLKRQAFAVTYREINDNDLISGPGTLKGKATITLVSMITIMTKTIVSMEVQPVNHSSNLWIVQSSEQRTV